MGDTGRSIAATFTGEAKGNSSNNTLHAYSVSAKVYGEGGNDKLYGGGLSSTKI